MGKGFGSPVPDHRVFAQIRLREEGKAEELIPEPFEEDCGEPITIGCELPYHTSQKGVHACAVVVGTAVPDDLQTLLVALLKFIGVRGAAGGDPQRDEGMGG